MATPPDAPDHAPNHIELRLAPVRDFPARHGRAVRDVGGHFHGVRGRASSRLVVLPATAVDLADELVRACGGTGDRGAAVVTLRGDRVPCDLTTYLVDEGHPRPVTAALTAYAERYARWWEEAGRAAHAQAAADDAAATAARRARAPATLRADVERAVKAALADSVPLEVVRATLRAAAEADR